MLPDEKEFRDILFSGHIGTEWDEDLMKEMFDLLVDGRTANVMYESAELELELEGTKLYSFYGVFAAQAREQNNVLKSKLKIVSEKISKFFYFLDFS